MVVEEEGERERASLRLSPRERSSPGERTFPRERERERERAWKNEEKHGGGELIDCYFSLVVHACSFLHAHSFLHAMIDRRRREDLNQEEMGRPKGERSEY